MEVIGLVTLSEIQTLHVKAFTNRELEEFPMASRKVIHFIANFRYMQCKEEAVQAMEYQFLHGYCYYFARMLQDTFGGDLYIVLNRCHIVWSPDGKYFYDITGVCNGTINKKLVEKATPEQCVAYKKL